MFDKTIPIQQKILSSIIQNEKYTGDALTEYDDSLTRRFIERIDVIDKRTIRITFIGGIQAEQVVE